MDSCSPLLIVVAVGPDRKQTATLTQIGSELRRRGLQAHRLRNWHEPAIGDFDVLLIGCGEKETESLARQIEDLWTQKWSSWYRATREKKGVNPVA